MRKIIAAFIILLLISAPVSAQYKTVFCTDKDAWNHFNGLVEKYPNDMPLQILHGLKIGLCAKIKQNSISENDAISLFNDTVDVMQKKREKEQEAGKKANSKK